MCGVSLRFSQAEMVALEAGTHGSLRDSLQVRDSRLQLAIT